MGIGRTGPGAAPQPAAVRTGAASLKRALGRRPGYHDVVDVLVRLIAALALFVTVTSGVGCSHVVTIETDPVGAVVTVDNKVVGESPVRVERTVFFGDQLRISAEREGYEPATISLAASEWYPWPGLLAAVPLLGLPISLPALLVPIAGPFIAAAIVVGWAVVTSPTLLSLALVRKYPDSVVVPLVRKRSMSTDVLIPSEGDPDDLGANPLPDVGELSRPPAPDKAAPRPPDGANPVP